MYIFGSSKGSCCGRGKALWIAVATLGFAATAATIMSATGEGDRDAILFVLFWAPFVLALGGGCCGLAACNRKKAKTVAKPDEQTGVVDEGRHIRSDRW